MTDRRTVQIVVVFLGLLALGGMAAITYLIDHDADASAVAIISGLTGTALGALGGLLTNSSSVDPTALKAEARTEAIADVASLALDVAPVVLERSTDQSIEDLLGPAEEDYEADAGQQP